MASKTTLNEKNLEALGAERLAALLMEISAGNANAKRRLRMELAGVESPDKLVHEIRKRLTSIGNATTNIGWRSLKAFKADLDSQRRLIVDQVAKASPADALDLLWQFIFFSASVLERASDKSGDVFAIFQQACEDLEAIATAVRPEVSGLIEKVSFAVLINSYGQNDALIPILAPLLGPDGLREVRTRLLASGKAVEARPAAGTRRMSRWRRGRVQQREALRRSRPRILHQALLEIADALGDVDAYIALQPDIRQPDVAAEVAERLLGAGRAEEALAVLDKARGDPTAEWQTQRLQALEALNRGEEAQAFRLKVFHDSLNRDVLKAYLKRLADFDDVEAEDAAMDFVLAYPDVHAALEFLIAWPSLDHAARLVIARSGEIRGKGEDIVPVAAEKLTARYPLAATLLLRRMLDANLANYREIDLLRASEHFDEARRLAARIEDYAGFETQDAYVTELRIQHSRKHEFWTLVT
ncbi:hypothetical Protein ABI_07550 [Asticcacaulis biprosthecium C19]|uniref:Uncharacterized protein n=1 Tax=Asticcacaulis biprosthecium C19 TaxID=715226 RepID=F4QLH5_9CAUL|nr:DUF6880 family protein [Asticcacaulis biprosthecium]EGF92320.1 hypothetical Protein ABI_07550 [Asticcacaulis biprosthecium C19]